MGLHRISRSIVVSVLLLTLLSPAVYADEIYWGAYIDHGAAEPSRIDAFEASLGKHASIIQWGESWWHDGHYLDFQTNYFESVRLRGSIPLVDWSSWDYCCDEKQPTFQLKSIYNGSHDAYIVKWAQTARNWGHPFFVRFDPEMNGWWTPWSEQTNGNQPGDFVKAWRHVHDIFSQQGATNATWIWCPNIVGPRSTSMNELYPGDSYVDWTCMDGYNWGTDKANTGFWSFADVFAGSWYNGYFNTYQQLQQTAPSKPILVGETASSEHGGSKAAWITDMLRTALPSQFPAVKGFIWFDWNMNDAGISWPLSSSPDSQRAFADGIASSYYAGNEFAALPPGPIQPLFSNVTADVDSHALMQLPDPTPSDAAAPADTDAPEDQPTD
jgi:mannan endo-1,4-beta-mannosidase